MTSMNELCGNAAHPLGGELCGLVGGRYEARVRVRGVFLGRQAVACPRAFFFGMSLSELSSVCMTSRITVRRDQWWATSRLSAEIGCA